MDWSLDTIISFINLVIIPPAVLCILGFYWVSFRRGIPVLIALGGGMMWSMFSLSAAGRGWNHLSTIFHLAVGILVFFVIAIILTAVIVHFKKKPSVGSRASKCILLLSLAVIGLYLTFNNHLIAMIKTAKQYTTPPETLERIAYSSLVWYSPTLFKELLDNPYTPEGALVYMYDHADTHWQQYQLLRHENMPCSYIRDFMKESQNDTNRTWMVAMAQRNHYMRCEVPEIYTLTEDELMERTPLPVLESMSNSLYGGKPPEVLQEWIEKKRALRDKGLPTHKEPSIFKDGLIPR